MAKHFEATQKAMLGADAPELSNEGHENVSRGTKPETPPVKEAPKDGAVDAPDELMTEKPEAAKEAPADAELPKGASPKSHEAFAQVKTQREALRAERDKLAAEVETLRKTPKEDASLKGEMDALRKRLADAEAIVERSAFEHSPTFKKFAAKEQAHMEQAKTYLDEGMDAAVLEAAARATGRARMKIMEDAGFDQTAINGVTAELAKIDEIQRDKKDALANQGELSAKWDAEQKTLAAQQEAHARAQEERTFDEKMAWAEKTMAPFQKVEGNEKWNAQVDRLKAEAREFALGSMPVDKLFELGMAGLAYKIEAARSERLSAMLKAEREKSSALTAAQPDGGITNGARPQNGAGLSLDQQRAAAFDSFAGRG
jgi:hypothetical protein